jgi:hypothetical protein
MNQRRTGPNGHPVSRQASARLPRGPIGLEYRGKRAVLGVATGAAVLAVPSLVLLVLWAVLVGDTIGLFFWPFVLYLFAPPAGLVYARIVNVSSRAERCDQATRFALLAPVLPTVGAAVALGILDRVPADIPELIPLLAAFLIVGGFFARYVARLASHLVFGRSSQPVP